MKNASTQVLSVFSIAMLLFSCDPFFLGKDLRDTPNYLVISSIVEIIVILLGFVPLFFKNILLTIQRF
ncbi:DUF5079 family protein [Staphylococcus simulans]|uniref:DUF5079 family protein n=2 Tax=Staphylococcus simulans TaxID=1286 RepID=UPI001D008882